MPRNCPHCKEKIIEKPISKLHIWEGEPFKSKFNWAAFRWGNLNLKNLLIGDWMNLLIIVTILFVAWSYTHDSAVYREIYSNPCSYVIQNIGACEEILTPTKQTIHI